MRQMKRQLGWHQRFDLRGWVALIFLLSAGVARPAQLNLIPLPATVTQAPGHFALDAQTVIVTDTLFTNEAALLADKLHLTRDPAATTNRISLTTQGAEKLGDEAYSLEVNAQGITVRARTTAGAFYGCQTLSQLMPATASEIPFVQIEDAPRYVWRGFMLDVSRNFFAPATIRQLIDTMAGYKLNRLHLHLADSQAWRLEISQYPKLTQIGAQGHYTDSPDHTDHVDTNAPAYFYTRAEMQELIAYAAQRHIVIVPEIDMPGHAGAAVRAYPQLDGGSQTFNPARPETYDFLQNVLLATMQIFPSSWIHFGGDEVNRASWNKNPDLIKKLKADGLQNTLQLENRFADHIAKFIQAQGRTPAGWDEIVAAKPVAGTVIFWWRHNKPEMLKAALDGGYSVVLTPRAPCYFDYPQDDSYKKIGWRLVNTPERVYLGPIIPNDVSAAQRQQILGVEGCLWAEHITSVPYLQFMTMPRLAALAEMAWTPDAQRDFAQFSERMKPFFTQYQAQGLHYYDAADPQGSLQKAAPFPLQPAATTPKPD